MTEQEIAALVNLLNRVPMTQAEALWVNSLLERLRPATVDTSKP